MAKRKPHLSIVRPDADTQSLSELADTQTGPLAEARAIADALQVFAVDEIQFRDDSFATFTHMLVGRLICIQETIEAELAGKDGAA